MPEPQPYASAPSRFQMRPSRVLRTIREGKVAQMYSSIQTSQSVGMQTLDQCLVDLIRRNMITLADARNRAVNKDLFMGG